MARWVRHIFSVPQKSGPPVVVSGPAYRGLAMLRVKTGVWRLTHMKTGASIISINGEKTSAYNFAEAVADLIDWGSYDDAEKIRNVDGLAGRIKAIAEMHSPYSAEVSGHA